MPETPPPTETELEVLKDIRALLRDLRTVLIDLDPDNADKFSWHQRWHELSEKIRSFPRTEGVADPNATVEYEGHNFSHAELLKAQTEAKDGLQGLMRMTE